MEENFTIDDIARMNSELSELKKKLEKAKTEIKSKGIGSYEGTEYKAIVECRVSSKLDTEKALKVAKEIGAKWIIKETIDEEALEDSIAGNEIDGSKFADCITEKKTLAVKFVKVKK